MTQINAATLEKVKDAIKALISVGAPHGWLPHAAKAKGEEALTLLETPPPPLDSEAADASETQALYAIISCVSVIGKEHANLLFSTVFASANGLRIVKSEDHETLIQAATKNTQAVEVTIEQFADIVTDALGKKVCLNAFRDKSIHGMVKEVFTAAIESGIRIVKSEGEMRIV